MLTPCNRVLLSMVCVIRHGSNCFKADLQVSMSRSLASSSGATADAVSHLSQVPPFKTPFVIAGCDTPDAWLRLIAGSLAQLAKVFMLASSVRV